MTNFSAELNLVTDYWRPRVVGEVNDRYVKVAKLRASSCGTRTRARTNCS